MVVVFVIGIGYSSLKNLAVLWFCIPELFWDNFASEDCTQGGGLFTHLVLKIFNKGGLFDVAR